ncbi:MoaD/ThiS family protein [Candidatus Thorarchaeota archaeon]|nr:MAG: MoaD/ThiS family protein [Candidatus Thorarchaeota archaeon]
MKVRLKTFGSIRRAIGQSVVLIEGDSLTTVRDAIAVAIETYGPELKDVLLDNDGAISGNMIVMLNGRDTELLRGLGTPISEDDEVTILPHVQGGG